MTSTKVAYRDSNEVSVALRRALNYLSEQSSRIDEPYMLAAYALTAIDLQDMDRAKPVVEKLRSLAHAEGSTIYWSLETNTPFYGWGLAGRVETSALVVQALSRYCNSLAGKCEAEPKLIDGGLLFLFKQKDRYGVWYSTQATINVLDALLTLFSAKESQADSTTESTAEIAVNGRVVQTIQMPAGNRLTSPITLDFSPYLSSGKNRVEIRRSGRSPAASVQAVATYYVPWSTAGVTNNAPSRANGSSGLRLVARFDKTDGKVNEWITCHVEAERVGFKGYGMMLAEIGLPPGAEVDRSSLDAAMKTWTITQYDVLPDRLVVYLWPRAGGARFDFQFRPRFALQAKSAPSVIYDYYNSESRAVVPPATFRVR